MAQLSCRVLEHQDMVTLNQRPSSIDHLGLAKGTDSDAEVWRCALCGGELRLKLSTRNGWAPLWPFLHGLCEFHVPSSIKSSTFCWGQRLAKFPGVGCR